MNLSEETSRRLNGWIGPDTWSSSHDLDWNRFYRFVDAFARNEGLHLDEGEVVEEITTRLKENREVNAYFQKEIQQRISVMSRILDFLRETQPEISQAPEADWELEELE